MFNSMYSVTFDVLIKILEGLLTLESNIVLIKSITILLVIVAYNDYEI